MSAASLPAYDEPRTSAMVEREAGIQRLVTVYVLTGLIFMLLPGTFLGVWNLISISSRHGLDSLSPAWIQAHGHAQVFGWIGTFVLGIGFYSLSKMGNLPAFVIARGWVCLAMWVSGVALRWFTNVTDWEWRTLLPLSAGLELAGFVTFFRTVSRHRPAQPIANARKREPWMLIVIGSTAGFLITLLANLGVTIYLAVQGSGPALPHALDQRLLMLPTWGFLVPAIWGFNARWLPVFLGLRPPDARFLYAAFVVAWGAIIATLCGFAHISTALLPIAAAASITALGVWEPAAQPPKTAGVHASFPYFVRGAYIWLAIASVLSIWAASADQAGGIWGASRHALTVGFLSTMVFAIGQRILPAFCGARMLFSRELMFASLLLLNLGCALRVGAEIPAYEGFSQHAWAVLPISALVEMTAVTLFAANLMLTFVPLPGSPHTGTGRFRLSRAAPFDPAETRLVGETHQIERFTCLQRGRPRASGR